MSEQEVFDQLKYRIEVGKDGTRLYYNTAGQLHRTDGPAVEYSNGAKEWWQNDLRHRMDGPAVEYPSGRRFWYQNGQLHRTDGPAIEYANGRKEWCQNDQLHRTDGPAIEWADGSRMWYINGEGLSEEEFIQSVRLMHAGYTPAITTLLDNGLPNYRDR